ncbi:cell surface protein [Brachyspira murdochii]|uniref:cell surface protein n=1 Tax=Brachyspira murdochii TaxID=84378 RepID=UPI0012F51617|nr:cell surface protein [Brachyspira murdochii]
MKKVLLTAMAIVTLASASAFGMYGNGDSWIDFLVHGNQFRARMDQLGFTLGNGTIKGTFGFRANTSKWGSILVARTGNNNFSFLDATLSAGIGYTSDAFGIGVGYNYTMKATDGSGIHTPVLTINALNDNLRIAIPFQIAAMSKDQQNAVNTNSRGIQDYMGIRTDIQIRYYTGIDAFNAIRLYVKYGQSGYTSSNNKFTASSLGLQLRLYFLNTTVGNVNVNPYIKLVYNQAIKGSSASVASYYYDNGNVYSSEAAGDTGAYNFTIAPVLGLGANSDVVSVWFEPSLGYTVSGAKNSALTHKLAWGAYAELYLTPVEDLEWYFELDVNNTDSYTSSPRQNSNIPVYFETTTGITWYLPSLGGEQ